MDPEDQFYGDRSAGVKDAFGSRQLAFLASFAALTLLGESSKNLGLQAPALWIPGLGPFDERRLWWASVWYGFY